MPVLHENWRALSIQQPWVDLILTGRKTIEVRYWARLQRRGGFIIHVSGTIDWKTTELLGYEDPMSLPSRCFVGYAEITDVIRLSNETRLARLGEHWIVHPFTGDPFGAVLKNVTAFDRPIPGGGKLRFFRIPESKQRAVLRQLEAIDINPALDPSRPTKGQLRQGGLKN